MNNETEKQLAEIGKGCGKTFILNGIHPKKEICHNFLCHDCENKLKEIVE